MWWKLLESFTKLIYSFLRINVIRENENECQKTCNFLGFILSKVSILGVQLC